MPSPDEGRVRTPANRVLSAPRGTLLEPLRLDGGRLSAMLHTPADERPRRLGLICPPILYEHQLCQRTLRSLAERLAASGIASLRLDYRGVGDSGGDPDNATLDNWRRDLRTAEEFLAVERGRVPSFRFGLRIGATLALDGPAVFGWDPVVDGSAYVGELEATHAGWYDRYGAHHGRHADRTSATGRVLGEVFCESTRESLRMLSPDRMPDADGRFYLIETEGCELTPADRSALEGATRIRTTLTVPGPAPWLADPDAVAPTVPARALERIAAMMIEVLS